VTASTCKHLVLLALLFDGASGCGPEIRDPELVSGYYRAAWIETDDGPDASVWSSDAQVGFTREFFDGFYADPVPLRADGESVEVPEPAAAVEAPAAGAGVHWKMRRLTSTGSGFAAEEAFEISFCERYHYTWTATALDEETIHVTRDGMGCGSGDGVSRIDDNRIDIEYVLVEPCEPPCEFVDDRDTRFPGVDLGDVILRENRCEC
jgi:hypothetical protein